jgi:hypothetical protein
MKLQGIMSADSNNSSVILDTLYVGEKLEYKTVHQIFIHGLQETLSLR